MKSWKKKRIYLEIARGETENWRISGRHRDSPIVVFSRCQGTDKTNGEVLNVVTSRSIINRSFSRSMSRNVPFGAFLRRVKGIYREREISLNIYIYISPWRKTNPSDISKPTLRTYYLVFTMTLKFSNWKTEEQICTFTNRTGSNE